MTATHFKIIDQTVGAVIVGLAEALFVTPFAAMLSPVFVVGMRDLPKRQAQDLEQ